MTIYDDEDGNDDKIPASVSKINFIAACKAREKFIRGDSFIIL